MQMPGMHSHFCTIETDKHTMRSVTRTQENGLGIWQESVYETTRYPFDASSKMFLYTDGVYEAKNPQGEEFTVERLQKLVSDATEQSAAKLIAYISEAIDGFTGTYPKEDDITLIAIEVAAEN